MSMKVKTCGDCKYFLKEFNSCFVGSENDKKANTCKYFELRKKLTNGDRIRQMGNTELAEIIGNTDCASCPANKFCNRDEDKSCYDTMLKWLNSPYESDMKGE